MTVKDEMKEKKLEKKKKSFPTIRSLIKQVNEQKQCIKDKDRRITKLENKFLTMRHLIGTAVLFIIYFLVIVGVFGWMFTDYDFFNRLIIFVGSYAILWILVHSFILCWIKIWDVGEFTNDDYKISYVLATTITFVGAIIISMVLLV